MKGHERDFRRKAARPGGCVFAASRPVPSHGGKAGAACNIFKGQNQGECQPLPKCMIIADLKINYRASPADTWWGSGGAEPGAPLKGPHPQKAFLAALFSGTAQRCFRPLSWPTICFEMKNVLIGHKRRHLLDSEPRRE